MKTDTELRVVSKFFKKEFPMRISVEYCDKAAGIKITSKMC